VNTDNMGEQGPAGERGPDAIPTPDHVFLASMARARRLAIEGLEERHGRRRIARLLRRRPLWGYTPRGPV